MPCGVTKNMGSGVTVSCTNATTGHSGQHTGIASFSMFGRTWLGAAIRWMDGDAFPHMLKPIRVGDGSLDPNRVQLRMNKSGNTTGNGLTVAGLPGWTAVSGAVENDGIKILPGQGGAYTATAQLTWSGGNSPKVLAQIRVNGASVMQSGQTTSSPTTVSGTINVFAGDIVSVAWYGEGSFWSYPTVQGGANTSLILEPVAVI